VPSSTKAGLEEAVKIADLFSKCSELAAQEEKEMSRIVGTVLPVLAYVDLPIALRPESLSESLPGIKSAYLHSGALVVTTDGQGNVSSRPLAKFTTADCVEILRQSVPQLQRLASEKRRAALVRPLLAMKVVSSGQRLILDSRSYRLIISNSGGDCIGLGLSVELPLGKTRPYRPRDLGRGARTELDIAAFKELEGAEQVRLVFECKDVDGRELRGEECLAVGGASFHSATLRRKN